MKLLRQREVLIVDFASSRWVYSNEVTLARVFYQSVPDYITDPRVQSRYLLDCNLFLLVSDPVLRVTSTSILVIADDVMLGGHS